ncbi:MAG: hypothetical protein MUP10_01125, partial [Methanoregulaceae archaeon]|nr:hypothetical protein [Methanoregulaceae archaeon]
MTKNTILPLFFSGTNYTLYHADCRELLASLQERSVDMIFADPPYNLSNGGFTCKSGRRAPVHKGRWDESRGIHSDFLFHTAWITACRRVLNDNGTLWISRHAKTGEYINVTYSAYHYTPLIGGGGAVIFVP